MSLSVDDPSTVILRIADITFCAIVTVPVIFRQWLCRKGNEWREWRLSRADWETESVYKMPDRLAMGDVGVQNAFADRLPTPSVDANCPSRVQDRGSFSYSVLSTLLPSPRPKFQFFIFTIDVSYDKLLQVIDDRLWCWELSTTSCKQVRCLVRALQAICGELFLLAP